MNNSLLTVPQVASIPLHFNYFISALLRPSSFSLLATIPIVECYIFSNLRLVSLRRLTCCDWDFERDTFEMWLLPATSTLSTCCRHEMRERERKREIPKQAYALKSEVRSWDFCDFFVAKGTTAIMHGVACHTIAFHYACIHPWHHGELAKGGMEAQRWSNKERWR